MDELDAAVVSWVPCWTFGPGRRRVPNTQNDPQLQNGGKHKTVLAMGSVPWLVPDAGSQGTMRSVISQTGKGQAVNGMRCHPDGACLDAPASKGHEDTHVRHSPT